MGVGEGVWEENVRLYPIYNHNELEEFMELKPSSKAIKKEKIDFKNAYTYAKGKWSKIDGLANTEAYWENTCLNFLTEVIHPYNTDSKRPRVMLLFSNPHPESVRQGLFMSELNSRGFWNILRNSSQLEMNHDFCWNEEGIRETVSLLLKGNYNGPLLFFDCLYQIPSKSPRDLKRLFNSRTNDFVEYIQKPSLTRIKKNIEKYKIKTVLIFTNETFDLLVNQQGISKGCREKQQNAVNCTGGNKKKFWKIMKENGLIQQVSLNNGNVTAIKVMDTRAKKWWMVNGKSTFAHVLDFALEYACKGEH